MGELKKLIKGKLVESDTTLTQLAKTLNTQPQNISNKLARETLTYVEVEKIADILGYSITWVKK